jgi:hypothetical protein
MSTRVNSECVTLRMESEEKRQKPEELIVVGPADPVDPGELVHVRLIGTVYHSNGESITVYPPCKLLVPPGWVEGLDPCTTTVLLPVCIDYLENEKETETQINKCMELLSAAELALVQKVRSRERTIETIGKDAWKELARLRLWTVRGREEFKAELRQAVAEKLEGCAKKWNLLSEKCLKISEQEAKKQQETDIDAFVKECIEYDKGIFSNLFPPKGATFLEGERRPYVTIVVTKVVVY